MVLPWSGFWERNYFAVAWPPLQSLLTNNFVRGAVTGLGLVNLGAGFTELARMFGARGSSSGSEPFDGPHDVTLRDDSGRS